ncbi:MAG: MFS transporter [Deltaproteobacteria bacterium]|jgi:MFS family permease
MNEKGASRFFYGYIVVAACLLIQGIGVGTYIAFGVLFKPLLIEFGWSRATISGASSLAFFLAGFLGMLVGKLNDKFGPRMIMLVTGIFYGTGHFLLSQLNSAWQLYLFYGVVVGTGLSSIDVIALTTTARWFVRRRGVMTGLVKVGTGAGQLAVPLLAGVLIMNYGWRFASVFMGVVVMLFVIASGQLLRRDPGQMGLLPDGFRHPAAGEEEGKAESGLSLREALYTGQFWMVCVINFLAVYCLLTVMVHIVPHATDLGIGPIRAAGVLSTIGGVSMVGRASTGFAIDRIGNKKSMTLCFILLIACFFWLQAAREMWMLYLFAVIYGIAHGGFFTVISPMVAELFGILSHGVLFGIVAFSGTVGGAIGPLLAGHIFDVGGSYRLVFLILAGVGVAGLFLTLFLKSAISLPAGSEAAT